MKWLPISELSQHIKGREMFVVKAFDVIPFDGANYYDSDPYCTWHEPAEGTFPYSRYPRWPHPFMPTHFCLLPDWEE